MEQEDYNSIQKGKKLGVRDKISKIIIVTSQIMKITMNRLNPVKNIDSVF